MEKSHYSRRTIHWWGRVTAAPAATSNGFYLLMTHISGTSFPSPLACYLPQERRAGWFSIGLTAAACRHARLAYTARRACRPFWFSRYSEKNVGYVAVSLLLRSGDTMMSLVINSIRNDLNSHSSPAQASLPFSVGCAARSLNGHNTFRSYANPSFRLYLVMRCFPASVSPLESAGTLVVFAVWSCLFAVVCFADRKRPEMHAVQSVCVCCFPVDWCGVRGSQQVRRKVSPSRVPRRVAPALLPTF